MNSTKLIYLEHMDQTTGQAIIQDVLEEDGKQVVVLDQTIFYPQGGGQPYDQGIITSNNGKFIVSEVRYIDGIVKHIGNFESGTFAKAENVSLEVNPERRLLNARLHSAGHLVDVAVNTLKPDWIPGRGYHFPDGPYVEYAGTIDDTEKEQFIKDLEKIINQKISEQIPVTIKFVDKSELSTYCRHVPENIPEGKPIRLVLFNDFAIPCGGTHVDNLTVLKSETIRKIKGGAGTVKISYDVS